MHRGTSVFSQEGGPFNWFDIAIASPEGVRSPTGDSATNSGQPLSKAKHGASEMLEAFERTEKRVVAISFLAAKIISVIALLLALILLEGAVVKRIAETEFGVQSAHAQTSEGAAKKCSCRQAKQLDDD